LSDGAYPVIDRADWYMARQALGRAGSRRGEVIALLKRRGKALGIPADDMQFG
jgi:hypothetical protein